MATLEELMAEKQRRQSSGDLSSLLAEKQKRFGGEPPANPLIQGINATGDAFTNAIKKGLTGMIGAEYNPIQTSYGPVYESVNEGLRNFGTGGGEALSNMAMAAKSTLTGDEYNPTQSGDGFAYGAGHLVGSILPFVVPGPHQATLPARIGTAAAAGGLFNPEAPLRGVAEGVALGGLGEAIPSMARAAGKGIEFAADKVIRNKYSKELMDDMTRHFKSSQKQAMQYLDPLLQNHGSEELTTASALAVMDAAEQGERYFNSKVNRMYKDFLKSPTINNAQKLQSQMGSSMREIKGFSAHDMMAKDRLENVRNTVIDSMKTKFDQIGGSASSDYDKFRNIYATEASIYQNNPVLNRVVHGERSGITPRSLQKSLQKATEGTRTTVPQVHAIRPMEEELTKKLSRSDLYQSALGGAVGYGALGPFGGIIGAGAPKALSVLKPDIANTLLNEELSRLLGVAGKNLYPPARGAALGAALTPSKEGGRK